jgi:anti-sigma regulatory factor (Ser/Thr protein kinase)
LCLSGPRRLLMADGPHPDESTGRGDRIQPGWPGPGYADGLPPLLDLDFDPGTLHAARARIRACATQAGFSRDQAEDVVLAVHELAANVICHGGGTGRLRAWALAGALHCQVDDGYLTDQAALDSLSCEPGHGLWVVRQVAGQMQTLSSSAGTSVLVRFDRAAIR